LKETLAVNEILVDARGHRCPVPTLRLRRACEAAAPGMIIRLLADDPMARIDAPHFAAQAGMDVLEVDVCGGLITVTLRKPALAEET
jgi:tRNA 2-thiouridine synthesizing protein A